MNRKGFTLVELLIIIIVIGLILIILIPKVQDMINDSKRNVAFENAQRLVRSFEEYYVRKNIGNTFQECSYDFTNDVNSCDDYSFDGGVPIGEISVSSDGSINGTITYNKYEFNVENGKITLVED